jgi:heparan-alpha-glucosaminide N-acetyltransferase
MEVHAMTELSLPDRPQRLGSLDAYRGFVMLLMASGGLHLYEIAHHWEGSPFWSFVGYEVEHAEWTGCTLWDLIQPSFMFLAGASIPFSYASRRARGQSTLRIAGHVVWRCAALMLLGIFLRSNYGSRTNFTFIDVVSQIGLGYGFVYLWVNRGWRVQLGVAAAILVGYWYLFAQHPLPGPGFDYTGLGLEGDRPWPFAGFAAHWDKNTNIAAAFDRWFLNLFPRAEPFRDEDGYVTLNFVPSMATMIFGLMTGQLLKAPGEPKRKLRKLAVIGALCLLLGFAVDGYIWPHFQFAWTLCPIVKRIWTPSWTVFAVGWTLLLLAAFYWLVDIRQIRRPVFPLVVVGMNSIAMYAMAWLTKGWIQHSLLIHLGKDRFQGLFGPFWLSLAALFVMWLICLWMYRRRIFLRI